MLPGFAIALERIEDENLSKKKPPPGMSCGKMPCGKNVVWLGPFLRNIWDIRSSKVSRFPPLRFNIPNCRKLHFKSIEKVLKKTMLSILRKARLKDKEMRILMLSVVRH